MLVVGIGGERLRHMHIPQADECVVKQEGARQGSLTDIANAVLQETAEKALLYISKYITDIRLRAVQRHMSCSARVTNGHWEHHSLERNEGVIHFQEARQCLRPIPADLIPPQTTYMIKV